ncbi:MAG: glycerate kinase, partial [Phycisphaeraceae bacterium]|nr:glycerate kinase [Phycisphaeraceae bacterium]
AEAAGLVLVPPEQRDPTRTTTYGVGQLIGEALGSGAEQLVVGIGGSATTDGGTGMAEALGVRFIGADHPMTGGRLAQIKSVDRASLDARLLNVPVTVACDVTNPLTGPNGAAAIYGPQKGATQQQVRLLEEGLVHLARCVEWVDAEAPGMGAAGGLGFGLVAFCGAELKRGIEMVLEAVAFEKRLRGCDLVITGEGCFDGQSLSGKATVGVAEAARSAGVPTLMLAGALEADTSTVQKAGFESAHAICDGSVTAERAMAEAAVLLEELTARVLAGRGGRGS